MCLCMSVYVSLCARVYRYVCVYPYKYVCIFFKYLTNLKIIQNNLNLNLNKYYNVKLKIIRIYHLLCSIQLVTLGLGNLTRLTQLLILDVNVKKMILLQIKENVYFRKSFEFLQ